MNQHDTLAVAIDRGQMLILFGLMITAMLMMILVVVDVGFYMHQLQKTQNAADAAALAGAQELPGSTDDAREAALTYVEQNGLDRDDVVVTFECTAGVPQVCNAALGTYDTIVVTPTSTAPSFFGGVLGIVGAGDSCWVSGCQVAAQAAGCRGACGPIGTGPVDAVMILDHSWSMSNSDLTNAKGAIAEVFTDFDFAYQQVGLAVTPPVRPDNLCDSINDWVDDKVWLPGPLTNTFQTATHVLNTGSPPVSVAACVDRVDIFSGELPYVHTNVGEPLKAAKDEIAAHGRADVSKGIVLVTDGAANSDALPVSSSTGERFCSSQAAVTSNAGDNNGYQTSAAQGCADDGSAASDPNSGSSSSTSCTSNNKDKHNFWGFGANTGIVSGSSIDGIEVRLDAWATGSGSHTACVAVSWNNGSSWSNFSSVTLGTTEAIHLLGSSSSTWGHSWSQTDLSNLRVRVVSVASNTSSTFVLDAVAVNVYTTHNESPPGTQGPCDYAVQQADAAKALDIDVYVIAFGATDQCSWDDPDSPWYDVSATEFLEELATDESYFFDEPKSTDLAPIFQAIGAQLTSGSRLVR